VAESAAASSGILTKIEASFVVRVASLCPFSAAAALVAQGRADLSQK
jgi:hypothetical protein